LVFWLLFLNLFFRTSAVVIVLVPVVPVLAVPTSLMDTLPEILAGLSPSVLWVRLMEPMPRFFAALVIHGVTNPSIRDWLPELNILYVVTMT
jgi:hypothetical protein